MQTGLNHVVFNKLNFYKSMLCHELYIKQAKIEYLTLFPWQGLSKAPAIKSYFLDFAQLPAQQTFQRCFDIGFRLISSRDVLQRQINAETTLRTLTLGFTTLNNVEPTMSSSKLIWITLCNVETTLSFSISICTTLSHVDTTLSIWPLKKWKN